MNFAQPESSAESLIRMAGAGAAAVGALTLAGLYAGSVPTNWLANIGVSIGDNSFKTLTLFGASSVIIGGALFMRKGLYLIVAAMLATLAWAGYGKWYSIGGKTSTYVKPVGIEQPTSNQSPFISTGVKLSADQQAWCNQDDNQNGTPNKYESGLAKQNCESGIVHKAKS